MKIHLKAICVVLFVSCIHGYSAMSLAERFQELASANKESASVYWKTGEKLRRWVEANGPRAKSQSDRNRVAAYTKGAELYGELAKASQHIVEQLDPEKTMDPNIEAAMKAFVELEAEIEKTTKKEVERKWLTFEEIEELKSNGYILKNPKLKVFPILRDHWMNKEEYQKLKMKKAAEARKRAAATAERKR